MIRYHNIRVSHLNSEEPDFIVIHWPHCTEIRHLPSNRWIGWTGQYDIWTDEFVKECEEKEIENRKAK